MGAAGDAIGASHLPPSHREPTDSIMDRCGQPSLATPWYVQRVGVTFVDVARTSCAQAGRDACFTKSSSTSLTSTRQRTGSRVQVFCLIMHCMDLTFGDLLSNALAEIKEHTGKKIGIVQDEISYAFSPALSSKTIESWRYRPAPPTIEQLETLAEAIVGYGCPHHDSQWLLSFLASANHPYPQAVCARFFPLEEQFEGALLAQFAPPPLAAYAPPQQEGFIGRSLELAHYRRLLSKSGLAIVSGMAGVGKTSVAAFLANEWPAEHAFWHGFRDANIQSLVYRLAGFLAHHDRAELWEMLEAARLTRSNPPDLTVAFDILTAQLPPVDLLLCLDDFHLVEENAYLQSFLQKIVSFRERRVKLLITTRRYPSFLPSLNQEELPGLTLDDANAFLTQREVALSEALTTELHSVTGGNATFLTLAAVALRAAPQPASLIARLAKIDDIERFLMLEVNDHLSGDEQRAMEAVAILKGHPAGRSVLEHILEQQDVRRVLRELEDQFLLTVEPGEQEREYSQHQIIQAFYYDQPRHDRRLALHKRAADYYAQVSFAPFLAVQQYALAGTAVLALQIARENMWAIVNEGLAASLLQILEDISLTGLDPLAELDWHLLCGKLHTIAGQYVEAQRYLEAAASRLSALPVTDESNRLKAQVCLDMAELLERQAPPEALTWIQRGLEVVPRQETQLAAALKTLAGTVNMHMGNFGGSLEMFHDGLDDLPAGLSPLRINTLKNLGAVYFHLGQLAEATDFSAQALAMSQQLRHHFQTARVYINLGPIKYVDGDWQGAIADLEEGLAIAQRLGSLDVILSLHTNLGGMYVEKGDHQQASRHLNDVLRLAGDYDTHQVVTAKIRLAQLHNYEAKWETADATLREAETLARQINDQASLATIFGCRAMAQQGLGQLEEAQRLVQEALALDKAFGYQFSMGQNLRILGRIAVALNDADAANEAFGRSLEILADLDPYQAALTQLSWGEWLTSSGATERGTRMLAEAQRQFESLGASREIEAVQKLVA